MTKKIEKIAAVLLFFTMFIFINQLEVGVLPFFIAFSGVISCGSLLSFSCAALIYPLNYRLKVQTSLSVRRAALSLPAKVLM